MLETLNYHIPGFFPLIFTSKIYDLWKLCWEYMCDVQVEVLWLLYIQGWRSINRIETNCHWIDSCERKCILLIESAKYYFLVLLMTCLIDIYFLCFEVVIYVIVLLPLCLHVFLKSHWAKTYSTNLFSLQGWECGSMSWRGLKFCVSLLSLVLVHFLVLLVVVLSLNFCCIVDNWCQWMYLFKFENCYCSNY